MTELIKKLVSLQETFKEQHNLEMEEIIEETLKELSLCYKAKDNKYNIITLCGSTKFKNEFLEEQKRLTLEGNIVISVGLFGHSGDNEVWENKDEGFLSATKKMLDDMHKAKIDMANEIFVINKNGYIGESTKSEIDYAIRHYKKINFLEEYPDFQVDFKSSISHMKRPQPHYIKEAYWIAHPNEKDGFFYYECSSCSSIASASKTPYCSTCGSAMLNYKE